MIDKTDKKILAILDSDGRASISSIAKKLNISKQLTLLRINKLFDKGIITHVYPIIDSSKLGFSIYLIFLKFSKPSVKIENKLLSYLVKNEKVGWIATCIGTWNIYFSVFSRDTKELYRFVVDLFSKFEENIEESEIIINFNTHPRPYSFVYRDVVETKYSDEPRILFDVSINNTLKNNEKKVLRYLRSNGRLTITDIAVKAGLGRKTVKNIVNDLTEKGILMGYRANINVHKLGFLWYTLLFRVKNLRREEENNLLEFLLSKPELIYFNNCFGHWNLILEVVVRTPDELRGIILDIQEKFPNLIRSYETLQIVKEHKYDYLPDIL